MKKTALALFLLTLTLGAADFWQSKPYTGWSDKDLQKIMTNSPWARTFTVPPPGAGGGGGDFTPPPMGEGRGGRGGGGGGGPEVPAVGGPLSLDIVARWQSALPLKQAFVRIKYGAEAATSPDAKAILDQAEPDYVIILSGPLQPFLRGKPEELKAAFMSTASLAAKGKSELKPTEVKIDANPAKPQVILSFSRTAPFTPEDKEIELNTKLGPLALKYKFRVRDMMFNGKLEL